MGSSEHERTGETEVDAQGVRHRTREFLEAARAAGADQALDDRRRRLIDAYFGSSASVAGLVAEAGGVSSKRVRALLYSGLRTIWEHLSAEGQAAHPPEEVIFLKTNKGRPRPPLTPEHRAKLSEANRSKQFTAEHRERLSESQRQRWQRRRHAPAEALQPPAGPTTVFKSPGPQPRPPPTVLFDQGIRPILPALQLVETALSRGLGAPTTEGDRMTLSVVQGRRELAVVPKRTICVDDVVTFLSGNRGDGGHWAVQRLKPISSHVWFLDENYDRVSKYCAAALAAVAAARQNYLSPCPRKIIESLASVILDRYGHDRASYVSAHLPDHPALEAGREIPRQVRHGGRVGTLVSGELSGGITLEVADRVAEVTSWAVPDSFFELRCEDAKIPYVPVLYASYGGWCIKVADYQ